MRDFYKNNKSNIDYIQQVKHLHFELPGCYFRKPGDWATQYEFEASKLTKLGFFTLVVEKVERQPASFSPLTTTLPDSSGERFLGSSLSGSSIKVRLKFIGTYYDEAFNQMYAYFRKTRGQLIPAILGIRREVFPGYPYYEDVYVGGVTITNHKESRQYLEAEVEFINPSGLIYRDITAISGVSLGQYPWGAAQSNPYSYPLEIVNYKANTMLINPRATEIYPVLMFTAAPGDYVEFGRTRFTVPKINNTNNKYMMRLDTARHVFEVASNFIPTDTEWTWKNNYLPVDFSFWDFAVSTRATELNFNVSTGVKKLCVSYRLYQVAG